MERLRARLLRGSGLLLSRSLGLRDRLGVRISSRSSRVIPFNSGIRTSRERRTKEGPRVSGEARGCAKSSHSGPRGRDGKSIFKGVIGRGRQSRAVNSKCKTRRQYSMNLKKHNPRNSRRIHKLSWSFKKSGGEKRWGEWREWKLTSGARLDIG